MENEKTRKRQTTSHLDRIFAVPMFVVTTLFLVTTGAFLHLIDGKVTSPLAIRLLVLLGLFYMPIIVETVVHWRAQSNNMRQHLWFLLLPFLRLCPRDHVDGSHAWIAGLGWRKTTPRLQQHLSRRFSAPMIIIIALLVLPVVGLEFFYAEYISENWYRKTLISATSSFIWVAFVYEFVVMVSIVQKPVRYCKANWIDVAIVLLPLVSFMGMARLGRLVKLKQLSRTAKIYRIRGLAIRSWRALVALDVLDTVLRKSPEDRMEKLARKIEEKQEEIMLLQSELARIKERAGSKRVETAQVKTALVKSAENLTDDLRTDDGSNSNDVSSSALKPHVPAFRPTSDGASDSLGESNFAVGPKWF